MKSIRHLEPTHLKRLPVGIAEGENLRVNSPYVDFNPIWSVENRQLKARWKSVKVAGNQYGQALHWVPNLLWASSNGASVTVRTIGTGLDGSVTVYTYPNVNAGDTRWPCPPGYYQEIELLFEREDFSRPFPQWQRPMLLFYQTQPFTGVPREFEAEVDDDEYRSEVDFFAPWAPNPSEVNSLGGELWDHGPGVYLNGRDMRIDLHFTDYETDTLSSEVEILQALDSTTQLSHPPMAYPFQTISFRADSPTSFVNDGGIIKKAD